MIRRQPQLSDLTDGELHARILRLAGRGPACPERELILAEIRRRLPDGGAR